jgi:hypothetical protein
LSIHFFPDKIHPNPETVRGYLLESIKRIVSGHPLIIAWIGLAIAMVAILLWASKDVGLLPGQLAALAVATIALAGACVWIISWE